MPETVIRSTAEEDSQFPGRKSEHFHGEGRLCLSLKSDSIAGRILMPSGMPDVNPCQQTRKSAFPALMIRTQQNTEV